MHCSSKHGCHFCNLKREIYPQYARPLHIAWSWWLPMKASHAWLPDSTMIKWLDGQMNGQRERRQEIKAAMYELLSLAVTRCMLCALSANCSAWTLIAAVMTMMYTSSIWTWECLAHICFFPEFRRCTWVEQISSYILQQVSMESYFSGSGLWYASSSKAWCHSWLFILSEM